MSTITHLYCVCDLFLIGHLLHMSTHMIYHGYTPYSTRLHSDTLGNVMYQHL